MTFRESSLRIVILFGPIGAGKSELAQRLRDRYGATIIKTRDLISKRLQGVKEERETLQKAGEKLDRADGGAWVKNALVRFIEDNVQGSTASGFFVVDSVRISGQCRFPLRFDPGFPSRTDPA